MAFESRGAWNARKSERGACAWTAVAASVAPKSLAALTEFSLSAASRWSSFGILMSRRTGQSPTPHTISSVTACGSTEESVPVSQRTHMLHAASMMHQPVRVCECAEPSPEPPTRVEGRRESACCGQRSYTSSARFSRSRRRSVQVPQSWRRVAPSAGDEEHWSVAAVAQRMWHGAPRRSTQPAGPVVFLDACVQRAR